MNIALTMLSLKLTGLKSYEKHILTVLCTRADEETAECWPSRKCLAIDTGLDLKTVQLALNLLSEKKIITKTGELKGKTKSTPVYRVNLSRPVHGLASNLSRPVYPESRPVHGLSKQTRTRVTEGEDLKDLNKDLSSQELQEKTQREKADKGALAWYHANGKAIPEHLKYLE